MLPQIKAHPLPKLSIERIFSRYLCVLAVTASFSTMAFELLLAAYASFLFGSTLFHYSLVISWMLVALGFGSLFWEKEVSNPIYLFFSLEIALSLLFLVALPGLYLTFAMRGPARFLLVIIVFGAGIIMGMELPLLTRLVREGVGTKDIIIAEYLGGFLGGVLFALSSYSTLSCLFMASLLSLGKAVSGFATLKLFSKPTILAYKICKFLSAISLLAATLGVMFCGWFQRWLEFKLFSIQSLQ